MSLSSNTLLHTTNKESVWNILKELKFTPAYCYEKIYAKTKLFNAAFPMVCFSDFPVSELKYRQSYGKYGIGLKKNWAKKNGLNPVLYVDSNSRLIEEYRERFDILVKKNVNTSTSDPWANWLLDFLGHMKNYQGHLVIKRLKIDNRNYRFSDEREWRYLPPKTYLEAKGIPFLIPGKKYQENKDIYNNRLESVKLPFDLDDINYIIVNSETEIDEIIRHIDNSHKGLQSKTRDRLISRIISMTRIKNDF